MSKFEPKSVNLNHLKTKLVILTFLYCQKFVKNSYTVSALFRSTKQGINDKYFETLFLRKYIPQIKSNWNFITLLYFVACLVNKVYFQVGSLTCFYGHKCH